MKRTWDLSCNHWREVKKVKVLRMKVNGDYACFTRPESKVERVSYPVMTASAARGVLESIFWKPEFKWEVLAIQVLKEPQFISLVRNEVAAKASITKTTMAAPTNYYANDHRQMRHTLMLKDVSYIIEARIHLEPGANGPIEKYHAMFLRRLKKGQCFQRPYLGARECAADFTVPLEEDKPVKRTEALGPMFYDFHYSDKGGAIPYFFQAEMNDGILRFPSYLFEEVNR